jgi:hypothetical protein
LSFLLGQIFMAFGMPAAKFVKRVEDVETLKKHAA